MDEKVSGVPIKVPLALSSAQAVVDHVPVQGVAKVAGVPAATERPPGKAGSEAAAPTTEHEGVAVDPVVANLRARLRKHRIRATGRVEGLALVAPEEDDALRFFSETATTSVGFEPNAEINMPSTIIPLPWHCLHWLRRQPC